MRDYCEIFQGRCKRDKEKERIRGEIKNFVLYVVFLDIFRENRLCEGFVVQSVQFTLFENIDENFPIRMN